MSRRKRSSARPSPARWSGICFVSRRRATATSRRPLVRASAIRSDLTTPAWARCTSLANPTLRRPRTLRRFAGDARLSGWTNRETQFDQLTAQRGAEGVLWPSATGSGESVAIFSENVQASSHVNLVEELPVNRAWCDAIADGTPVSHFLRSCRATLSIRSIPTATPNHDIARPRSDTACGACRARRDAARASRRTCRDRGDRASRCADDD